MCSAWKAGRNSYGTMRTDNPGLLAITRTLLRSEVAGESRLWRDQQYGTMMPTWSRRPMTGIRRQGLCPSLLGLIE
jgi:hypothetical protein